MFDRDLNTPLYALDLKLFMMSCLIMHKILNFYKLAEDNHFHLVKWPLT